MNRATLYFDKVYVSGTRFKLQPGIRAWVDVSGSVYSTSNVTSVGRPTLTRIVAGGIIAGPVGAVIGGAVQKKKVVTDVQVHDDRMVYIYVEGAEGVGMISVAKEYEAQARSFVNNVNNAVKRSFATKKKETMHYRRT